MPVLRGHFEDAVQIFTLSFWEHRALTSLRNRTCLFAAASSCPHKAALTSSLLLRAYLAVSSLIKGTSLCPGYPTASYYLFHDANSLTQTKRSHPYSQTVSHGIVSTHFSLNLYVLPLLAWVKINVAVLCSVSPSLLLPRQCKSQSVQVTANLVFDWCGGFFLLFLCPQ